MSYSDLRDFDAEYIVRLADGETGYEYWVEIEKLGGGTIGEMYVGIWRYMIFHSVSDPDSLIVKGQDLHSGTPINHLEAARSALDFYLAGSCDESVE